MITFPQTGANKQVNRASMWVTRSSRATTRFSQYAAIYQFLIYLLHVFRSGRVKISDMGDKMKARSLPDLVNMAARLGFASSPKS